MGKSIFLPTTNKLLIGRSSNSNIRVNNNLVSRNQCEIELDGNTPILFNLSAKGTMINQIKVNDVKIIKNGDEITIPNGEKFILHNVKNQIIEDTLTISSDEEDLLQKNKNEIIYISSESDNDDEIMHIFGDKITINQKKNQTP